MSVQEASSSSAASRCSYHVFLSFRGRDTRTNFTDHLYTAVVRAGIRTFRDDDELPRGESVDSELHRAIRESKVSVIVFSKDYASSKWCLDELVRILGRRAVGHMVLPVFYDVDPSVVENQRDSFGESFARHRKKFMAETEEKREEGLKRMETWRVALKEAANLAGMVLKNQVDGHEAKFVQKIVKELEKMLKRMPLNVALHPVGSESRVKSISSWLQDKSSDVGIGLICGMGGIGKTTIAKVAYNLNFMDFEASCFLANIRENAEKADGLVRLQRQFLSDVSNGKIKKISSVAEGIVTIEDAVNCKRILLVLDDVDQDEHLEALIGTPGMFFPGSKIVVTTRREHLLMPEKVQIKCRIKELDDEESLRLFSLHAFGKDQPPEDYLDHSRSVIRHCEGLPLALQVLGSSLCQREIEVWSSSLQKLGCVLHTKIRRVLEISYRSLQDDHDRNLFVQIANSHVGKDRDEVAKILEESEFYTDIGIQNLIDRGLLMIDDENRLVMHQLLQQMGREILRQERGIWPRKRNTSHGDVLSSSISTEENSGGRSTLESNQMGSTAKKAKWGWSNELSGEFSPSDEGGSLKMRVCNFFSKLSLSKLLFGRGECT